MQSLPEKLRQKMHQREADNALRKLVVRDSLVDFTSNDYLGFARSPELYHDIDNFLKASEYPLNGATGSRLLSGNHSLNVEVESFLSDYYHCEAALVFNSGFLANQGILASLPQRDDLVIYDEYAHASIRDGLSIGLAKSLKFKHNDLHDLLQVIRRAKQTQKDKLDCIYIVTESVFSMDGDSPDLKAMVELCKAENCRLIVDEAHALGIFGSKGRGLIEDLNLRDHVFARIITFGKALGCHGATILGTTDLVDYLVNFARSFIYTTAMSPHSLSSIIMSHKHLDSDPGTIAREKLLQRIFYFKKIVVKNGLENRFIPSYSAVQSCVVPGNEMVKNISEVLIGEGYDVRPILAPTVARNSERLRFCLHSYNTEVEIKKVLDILSERLTEI